MVDIGIFNLRHHGDDGLCGEVSVKSAEKLYLEKVTEAKVLLGHLRNTNEYRMRIAGLAVEACEIVLGGHKGKDRYTLVQFAKDIGMNHSTLHDWVRVKTLIYDKITEKQRKKFVDLSHNQLQHLKAGLIKTSGATEVRNKYDKLMALPEGFAKAQNYIRHLRSFTECIKKDRNSFQDSQVRDARDLAKEAYQLLEKEMARRVKPPKAIGA